jgi:hypothetical protein
MNTIFRVLCVSIPTALHIVLGFSAPSHAQSDVRSILRGVIVQLQTGQPNPMWYGTQLWQMIALQTGNTGVQPALVVLGPVKNVAVVQQSTLPSGVLYALSAEHQNGTSFWILGVSTLTKKIEYATFTVGEQSQEQLPSSKGPVFGGPSIDPPSNSPPSNPSPVQKSAACEKFPNLC